MSRWSALHVHLHGGPEQAEAVLRSHIVPATGELLARGDASSWFFVRYWEGGPHLRWRVADASPATVRRLRDELTAVVAALPAPDLHPDDWYARFGAAGEGIDRAGWQPHGTVREQPYLPEIDRYGGPAAIGPAEELFAASSRVAGTLIGAAPARRRSATVDMLFAFLAGAGLEAHQAAEFLRNYANGWTLVREARDADLGLSLITAERDFHADPAAFAGRQRLIADVVASRRGAGTSINFWADAVTGYVTELQALARTGRLHGPIPGILASQLHMLHNRLGLSIPAECQLAWLASFAYARSAAVADFHADGLDAPDRAYHEQSKFVRALWPGQHPRKPAGADPSTDGPVPSDGPDAGGLVWLPEPTPGPLGDASLAEVLLARRTRYDFGGTDLAPAQLSRLLRYSAGVSGAGVSGAGGAGGAGAGGADAGQRPYPSAGGLAGTRLMVLPRRVTDVPPALYEYLPDQHALHRVAPDPGTGQLGRVAPQFDPADPDGLAVGSVALWLFVVVDLPRSRARYGARAYRFAAVETGHLAQNLLLSATALGLHAVPVGGFYDDYLDHLLLLDGLNSFAYYVLALGPASGRPPA